jgi:probable rRNA maturation factor
MAAVKKRRPARSRRKPMARPDLQIVDRGRPRTDRAFLRRVVQATLQFASRSDLAVSLLLTDDEEIGRLHAQFLGDPSPTDVISFPPEGDDAAELVASVETASRIARERGHRVRDEVALYVVHGLLHCCGFDDLQVRARARMRAAERAVLAELGIVVAAVDE